MRNLILFITLCLISTASKAQYKKTSFNSKRGVTLEVTARSSFITKSECNQLALAFSLGKERSESRYFSWHDFEFLLPTNFTYTTSFNSYSGQVYENYKVHARSLPGFQYRFNSGIFLVNNSEEETKLLPFINFGGSVLFHGGTEELEDFHQQIDGYPEKSPGAFMLYAGINAGAGLIYKINSTIGLKATAGYSLLGNLSELDYEATSTDYYFYKSHPYATVGIRFVL